MASVLPPKEVFNIAPQSKSATMGGYEASGWYMTTCPAEGGMYAHYVDEPYPRSGHMHTDACDANNITKKATIGIIVVMASPLFILQILSFLLVPFYFKRKMAVRFLEHYLRFADYVNHRYYLQYKFYHDASRQLWRFSFLFLRHLGIPFDLAFRFGRLIANLFQWEESYMYRLQDLFSESTLKAWLENPRKELNRIGSIYISREKSIGKWSVGEKFMSAIKLVSLVLLLPRIRKAFTKAMAEVEFNKLQLRENDKYFVLRRNDYEFMGESVEVRQPKYARIKNLHNLQRAKKVLKEEEYIELEKQVLAL